MYNVFCEPCVGIYSLQWCLNVKSSLGRKNELKSEELESMQSCRGLTVDPNRGVIHGQPRQSKPCFRGGSAVVLERDTETAALVNSVFQRLMG